MATPPLVLDVVCLCAAWCGTCREYEATFAELQQALPQHRYRWIDIEDEADFVGDVDVETFPTLLVAWQGQVMFAGPVLPRLGDAQRLIEVQQHQAERGQVPGAALLNLPADQIDAFEVLARSL
ncbi:MAG: thioredoxin family protein [Aquabacterium sp.]|uniref:thioredoxin family protein n=1 Tax=Aquabacterium sp. TaxID=1872578 RepID=UPI0025C1949F|nr:thioredoxin family protein [Aquabacterium sp.]MBI5926727.1 thioredoxin family protein [Aquabacterium sp.]